MVELDYWNLHVHIELCVCVWGGGGGGPMCLCAVKSMFLCVCIICCISCVLILADKGLYYYLTGLLTYMYMYRSSGMCTVYLSAVLTRRNGGENYLAEPKLFILTNWRFVIGGSLRIFKFMAIYNWRK